MFSIHTTRRLVDVGIKPSVGNVRDAYNNALAKTINGLYKNELIDRNAPWKTASDLEMKTLK